MSENAPRPDRATELDQNRDDAVNSAWRELGGKRLDQASAREALYALYDSGFNDGAQDEYSYPS